jgi:hypothetical protein
VLLHIIAYRTPTHPNPLTRAQFWPAGAALAGFPARKRDGQPAWKRLWQGCLRLLDLAEGATMALNLPPLLAVANP